LNILVVYDSTYGNTEMIAHAIAEAIGGSTLRASEGSLTHLKEIELLILGSSTHGGFPTPSIDALVKALPALGGAKVAAFDTRTRTTIFGYAAPKIARRLEKAGGNLVAAPEGFLVRGTQGPLIDGELERSMAWAESLV
jgi:flavodoxin